MVPLPRDQDQVLERLLQWPQLNPMRNPRKNPGEEELKKWCPWPHSPKLRTCAQSCWKRKMTHRTWNSPWGLCLTRRCSAKKWPSSPRTLSFLAAISFFCFWLQLENMICDSTYSMIGIFQPQCNEFESVSTKLDVTQGIFTRRCRWMSPRKRTRTRPMERICFWPWAYFSKGLRPPHDVHACHKCFNLIKGLRPHLKKSVHSVTFFSSVQSWHGWFFHGKHDEQIVI